MSRFEPIAIVGEGCVLPAARSPEDLWNIVAEKRVVTSRVPPARLGFPERGAGNPAWVSGLVEDTPSDAPELDPVCRWPLEAVRSAAAGIDFESIAPHRRAVILANLMYPSRAKAAYAADIWQHGRTDRPSTDLLNSGYPAKLIAEAIGATGPAFALDAACASSLYALEIACRKLAARQVDIAAVAAVNATDNLILHIGFSALKALSPTGRSRPFISGADGLVPSEGAAAVILKRLSDVKAGDTVHGVIRGIGLSNDGRRKGLLAPDSGGQAEAMRRAYEVSGINPDTVQYLECHATGTPVGDGVEIAASASVFGSRPLPIGSLKANTGHLITVAGLASLLKLTSSFRHETLAPTPLDGALIPALAGNGMQPLREAEPWRRNGAPRRAAISNFGFGGNNSHLILEQHEPRAGYVNGKTLPADDPPTDDIVICGIGLMAGPDRGERAVLRRLMNAPIAPAPVATTVGADPVRARTPPADLLRAEAQQLAILDTASMALEGVSRPAPEACGVFTGVRCANDSARWLLRERIAAAGAATAADIDAIAPPLVAADVLGAMANMTANRLTVAEDFRGRGFAISAEEGSGLSALDAACDALRQGSLDLAVVAAADFGTEPVSAHTIDAPGDKAAAIVLKRRADAEAAGDRIYGTVAPSAQETGWPASTPIFSAVYGHAPAADDLFSVAARLALAARGLAPMDEAGLAAPCLASAAAPFEMGSAVSAPQITVTPAPVPSSPDMLRPAPHLFWAAAGSRPALAKRLGKGDQGGRGRCRIALLANSAEDLAALSRTAAQSLEDGAHPSGDGVFYGDSAAQGELAFAFTGSAASYPRMGRGLLSAFPEVAAKLAGIPAAQAMTPVLAKSSLTEFEQLCAVSLLTQAHVILLREVLGLQPEAAIGLSLGESNALFAFGYWNDMGGLLEDISNAAMYERHLGGEFETAREAWGRNVPSDWTNWRLRAPIDKVRAAVAAHPNVEIMIIYSEMDSMIGGRAEACRAVADAIGKGAGALMHQHLIVHASAMKPFAEKWRQLHTRPVSRIADGPRLYANAINAAYKPTKAKVADMLTRQAVTTVDFPATVRQAWEDGVRTFVEVGPRDSLTQSIRLTLKDKPHLALATDEIESADLTQIARLAAALFAEGRDVQIAAIAARLDAARAHPWRSAPPLPVSRGAHSAPPVIPKVGTPFTCPPGLPLAPPLPPPVYARLSPTAPPPAPVPFPPPPGGTPSSTLPQPEAVLSGRQPLMRRAPSGKSWNREAIEKASRGPMSDFFGPAFAEQDRYARNVRLPAPPLLLVDRITGIEAEAGVEGKGVIWTETDLTEGHWMLHKGRIRPGPLIECGQADLTLIGWMGADLKNRDERVYRLLGCEITFHDSGLPRAGDTLKFQIEITQHANFGGVRMFFFQYDCESAGRPVFSVRQGQAGFFSDAELASGKGVAWDAATSPPPTPNIAPIDISRASARRAFSQADVSRFQSGNTYDCFGPGFELSAAHSFPVHLPDDHLALIHEVPEFDPEGGPWKRGYLKARAFAPTDAWFYQGHFHNDPCMPGTLMAEAAVQALEFYATALGLTLTRDGHVFEPIPGETAKFICRGQVIPDTDHEITYEVFIDEIIDGETPKIFAALLARSDGRKVFYCPRFGIQLRRNGPAPRVSPAPVRVGPQRESRGDYAALLDCANGAPSSAFGEMYQRFDTEGSVPRLPQPPYHMMSRVTDVTERPGVRKAGARVSAEYDIPPDAWYFGCNRNGEMPFSVLSEIVLQPCGWLASHCGFALDGGDRFRNLEGDGHVFRTLKPGDGTICVETTLTAYSKVGPMTIVTFELDARLKSGAPVMRLMTRFGFFPAAALVRQAGLAANAADKACLALPPAQQDLSPSDDRLAAGQLRMLDTADYFDPHGGAAGLGLARGRQAVDPHAWYFKAHFFGDPVQPGSLGLDALVQLLMRASILKGLTDDMPGARAETLAAGMPVKWTYRGQVTPEKKQVTTVMEITDIAGDARRRLVTGRGSLWCDGLRIYEANPLTIAFTRDG
ncbi:beta-ketoacyl synthase N-terminal-like domain-containing protein [Hyphomonas sp.]|uniref:beta-ketoacyl synthase N-terminal-like domain-containing protein n=1 Tax=Hyphomonas sp. TaxID=87 RepID=UPI00391B334D